MTAPEPTAWAIYGRKTGALRHVVQDEDIAIEMGEHYDIVPLYPAPKAPAPVQAARDTFARWENGDGSEQELAGALHGLIESYSPSPEVGEALELLDTLNESGRMRDDDYAELHALVSQLGPAPEKAVMRTDHLGDDVGAAIMVEAAAKAMFEHPDFPGDYTWAQMVEEDPSRALLWRQDAARVLVAAGALHPRHLDAFRDPE